MQSDFNELCNWSDEEFSVLPWRQNRTLYTTLVSEIMLQQTTVSTVLPRFPAFLKIFPTITKLANANEDQLRQAWLGLGYYRRAANLLKASQNLAERDFPSNEEELCKIPGIGPYTASAIRSIGHDLPALAVDGNLKRVLSRYFLISTPYEKGLEKDIRALLENKEFLDIICTNGARRVNEAIMDLGRSICTIRKPRCEFCPLKNNCQAKAKGVQTELPVRIKKAATKLTDLKLLRFICIEDDKILLYKKKKGEWLENQWELPTANLSEEIDNFKQYPLLKADTPEGKALKSSITRYRIANFTIKSNKEFLLAKLPQYEQRDIKFFPLSELPILTTTSTKILQQEKITS
ncbi:MAG: A/G-specific adenine glycosylase [Lentisphaeraceae bacterium]|nr:A/G-specific adenine glycosylase [Lentisphaeraceae bacterium]